MGTYAFVDTEVVTNQSTSQQFQPGQPLLRRPQHSGSVRAAYTYGRATVNFNLRVIGQRFDNSFLFLRTVPNSERPLPSLRTSRSTQAMSWRRWASICTFTKPSRYF